MGNFWSSIKDKFNTQDVDDEEQYVTLEGGDSRASRFTVRPFVLNEYEDIKTVLNALRSGNTIVLLNISPLKEKDIVELKRAINKLKKTTDACNGEVAGFGDDMIVATPASARIFRGGGEREIYDE